MCPWICETNDAFLSLERDIKHINLMRIFYHRGDMRIDLFLSEYNYNMQYIV